MASVTSPHKIQEKFSLVAGTALRAVYIRVPVSHYPYIRAQKVQKSAPVYTSRVYGYIYGQCVPGFSE